MSFKTVWAVSCIAAFMYANSVFAAFSQVRNINPTQPQTPQLASSALSVPARREFANFLGRINGVRVQFGRPPVVGDVRLDMAARIQCETLARTNVVSHQSPDQSTPGTRVDSQGYRWNIVGENIFTEPRARTLSTREPAWVRAFNLFAQDPASRAVVLGNFMSIGSAGCQNDGATYWVQVYAMGDLQPSNQYFSTSLPGSRIVQSAAPLAGNVFQTGTDARGRPIITIPSNGAGPAQQVRVINAATSSRNVHHLMNTWFAMLCVGLSLWIQL